MAAVLAVLLTSCNVVITSHQDGAIVPAGTTEVTGTVPAELSGGTVTVNGVPGTIQPDGKWSATIPTGAVGEVLEVTAVFTQVNGNSFTHTVAVVTGPSIDIGAFDLDGVALRFTNAGLDGLGPVINNLAGASFDISGMLLARDPLVESSMLGINIRGHAYAAGVGNVEIVPSSTASGVRTAITVDDLYIGLTLNIGSSPCMLELEIPTVDIDAYFDMEPLAADPSRVDVNMIGNPTVTIPTVNHEFLSGICDADTPVIGPIVDWIAGGQIQSLIADGFNEQLGDPDGSGPADSPIAEAIETALAEISIAGPVGEAVQADLRAPFTSITEQADGIHMRANASFQASIGDGPGQCAAHPHAPDLASTFAVPGAAPAMGPLTPDGVSYGLGLGISASSFNQLLGAMTECGAINQEVAEIDFLGTRVSLSAAVLSALVPAFSALPPTTPMMIRVVPTVAPYLTGAPGPQGEPAELKLSNLELVFVDLTDDTVWLTLGVDAPLGFDLAYDAEAGVLAPALSAPPADRVKARIKDNRIGATSDVLPVFESLFPTFVADIGGSFAAFPLPAFMGLELEVIEVESQGSAFVLYANLNPGSMPTIRNVSVTDNSTADFVQDGILDVAEWRHRIRTSSGQSNIKVDFKAMLGADACCFSGSKSADATARYTLNFRVDAEAGEAWKLDLSQAIKGGHTIQEEDLGSANTAIRNGGVIAARGRVGGGGWTNFDVTIAPAQRQAAASNGIHVPFAGANSAVLTGTGTQNVSVEVDFVLHAHSESTWTLTRWWAGDEAAIRLGLQDSIANGFTAGEYPGFYPRNIAEDGHQVLVAVEPVG